MIENYQQNEKELVAKLNVLTTILNIFMEAELSYRLKLCSLDSIVT